ncbi:hypothetical protein PV726_30410 [Streptomyces europaeiscabiei]|uniref:hypothetical protein n=1 Tax=Streptomyces europaeiscabiei TaxID=146819 RepID=UPI0029B3E7A0|nr:hypothetical protein [Streptomyces europaeiscabiei]MDX3694572.1 hypothetical protein [Streptomyces europaeiscabiei]
MTAVCTSPQRADGEVRVTAFRSVPVPAAFAPRHSTVVAPLASDVNLHGAVRVAHTGQHGRVTPGPGGRATGGGENGVLVAV